MVRDADAQGACVRDLSARNRAHATPFRLPEQTGRVAPLATMSALPCSPAPVSALLTCFPAVTLTPQGRQAHATPRMPGAATPPLGAQTWSGTRTPRGRPPGTCLHETEPTPRSFFSPEQTGRVAPLATMSALPCSPAPVSALLTCFPAVTLTPQGRQAHATPRMPGAATPPLGAQTWSRTRASGTCLHETEPTPCPFFSPEQTGRVAPLATMSALLVCFRRRNCGVPDHAVDCATPRALR